MIIEIIVKNDNEKIIGKHETISSTSKAFEDAEEGLEKLKKFIENK